MLIASPLHPQATSHRDKPFIEADLAAGSSHTQGGGDLVIPEASTRLSGGARPAPGFPPPSHAGILFPRLWARAGGHHCSGAAATLSLRDAVGPGAHGGHRTCSRFSAGWERGRKTSRRGRPPQADSGPAPCVHWASCRCVVRGEPCSSLSHRVRHTHSHTYTLMLTRTNMRAHTHTHTLTHAHIHACLHTLKHMLTHTHSHAHTHACLHTLKHAHAHMHSLMHTHMHTHTRLHTHAHTLIHTHTYSLTLPQEARWEAVGGRES